MPMPEGTKARLVEEAKQQAAKAKKKSKKGKKQKPTVISEEDSSISPENAAAPSEHAAAARSLLEPEHITLARESILRMCQHENGNATPSEIERPDSKVFVPIKWLKNPTGHYTPSIAGQFDLGASKLVLDNIQTQRPFSFNIDQFVLFMNSLGIRCSGQKGSHMHFETPDNLPKIFVDPHGGATDRFGPGAMERMLVLVNSLSLGTGSVWVKE